VWFQKISIPPKWMGFYFEPSHPSGNSRLAPYFPSKILDLETPTPSEFPMTIHREGMDIF